MSASPALPAAPRAGALDRLLRPFADVRAGEGGTAVLLMLNCFLLLTAYYILKTVREPLILAGGGAEVKSYAAAGQALLLLGLVPAYAAFATRVDRVRLIGGVTAFFVANLVGFWALERAGAPFLGVAFFLWVGIFNLMITAQFWSFANDVYDEQQGRRLFAIVAFGSTLGAILGAWVAKLLIGPLGVSPLMLVAGGILVACVALTVWVDRRERRATRRAGPAASPPGAPIGGEGAFRLIRRSGYLMAIALLMTVLNFVNTNGEYILGKTVTLEAARLVAAGAHGAADPGDWTERFIGGFYGDYFWWVNVVAALLQLFVVSRVLQWFGVRTALFVLPVIALGGYGFLALAPALGVVRVAKILENSTDYSLQNTARQALFLPTSREAKYKAKAAIDSFFWRGGDVLSSLLVYAGVQLALTPRHFAAVNLVLVAAWLGIVAWIASEHRRLTGGRAAEQPAP